MKDQLGYEYTSEDPGIAREAYDLVFLIYQTHHLLNAYGTIYGDEEVTSWVGENGSGEAEEVTITQPHRPIGKKAFYTLEVFEKKQVWVRFWAALELLDIQSFRCQLSDSDELHINAVLLAYQCRLLGLATKKVTKHRLKFPTAIYKENLGKYVKAHLSEEALMYKPSYTKNMQMYYPGLYETAKDAKDHNSL